MSDLNRVLYWRGISDHYLNYRGEHTVIPLENRLELLKAMGVNTEDETALRVEALNLDFKPWLSWLPSLFVTDNREPRADISVSPAEMKKTMEWRLCRSGFTIAEGFLSPSDLEEVGEYHHQGERYSRRRMALPALEPDYYELSLMSPERSESTIAAFAPETAFQPELFHGEHRPWGFVLQLYTLKSERNWGIGDFSDLAKLIQLSAPFGVDVLGLNPFHALKPNLREHMSPYSPSDRRYLNPLYIDVELVPGYEPEMRQHGKIDLLQQLDHVDYPQVKQLKYECLYACFENYVIGSTGALSQFIDSSEGSLIDFANYELANTWQSHDGVAMSVSRQQLVDLLSDSESALPVEMYDAAFHCFLQWIAQTQLNACQDLAVQNGMKLGLVRDLAVGASGGGAEVQTNAELFCDAAAIGAPPDPLALTGQNWGVPPMDPAKLRATGFKHFRELLRTNMSSCGALRIDHAMSLYRLWWCPPGETADKGAYVYYPFDELIGLLCLESHLNETAIIAEDLGVVPDEFRNVMRDRGLLGNRLFYFEKWHDTEFKAPKDYDKCVLAMASNHDVPTMVSWWNETDLTLRSNLDLLEPGKSLQDVCEYRRNEKSSLLKSLHDYDLLPGDWSVEDNHREIDLSLMDAILCFCAQCASKVFMIQLEDVLMMNDPVNVPGTYKEYRNWSRKLNRSLRDVFSDKQVTKTLNRINSYRNG